jgi:2',3'-cyclic-nucleotide 2'-phosphodiesterase (5'-nucleotidase family)
MIKRRIVFASLILAVMLFTVYLLSTKTTLYYTANVNGYFGARENSQGEKIGGFAILKNLLSQKNDADLILSGGGWFLGTPEGEWENGLLAVELFNEIGYDAVAFSNRDLEYGWSNLKKNLKEKRFPVLGTNVEETSKNPVLVPYVIKSIRSIKIGIIGFVNKNSVSAMPTENLYGLKFNEDVPSALKYVQELKKQDVDCIIALTYSDDFHDNNEELIKSIKGINLILSSNPHIKPKTVRKFNSTYIIYSDKNLESVQKIILKFSPLFKNFKGISYKDIVLEKSVFEENPKIKARIDDVTKTIDEKSGRTLSTAEDDIEISHSNKSPLGTLVTSCLSTWQHTGVALVSSYEIKRDLKKGPITERDLFEILPENHEVVRVEMRGEDIRKVLERNSKDHKGFLNTVGIETSLKPDGSVKDIFISSKRLRDDEIYNLITTDYLLAGGYGNYGLSNLVEFVSTRQHPRRLMELCLRKSKKIDPGKIAE